MYKHTCSASNQWPCSTAGQLVIIVTCPVASGYSSYQIINMVSSDCSGPMCVWACEQSREISTTARSLTQLQSEAKGQKKCNSQHQKCTVQESKHNLYRDTGLHLHNNKCAYTNPCFTTMNEKLIIIIASKVL